MTCPAATTKGHNWKIDTAPPMDGASMWHWKCSQCKSIALTHENRKPPARRRPSTRGFGSLCDFQGCRVNHCTNPDHPGSWIPDDAYVCLSCNGVGGQHAQYCPKQVGLKPAKEIPVCSSPNVLSSDDLRLIEQIIQKNRPPHPDAAERAKEREHETAMHQRECNCLDAPLDNTDHSWVLRTIGQGRRYFECELCLTIRSSVPIRWRDPMLQCDPGGHAAERAKEREHEAAMHRRESEESIEKHRQSHITLTRVANLAGASCISGVAAFMVAASIFCMSQCASETLPTAKPKPAIIQTAEQMFGMGGK